MNSAFSPGDVQRSLIGKRMDVSHVKLERYATLLTYADISVNKR